MKISRDKINHISSLIVKDFSRRDELDYKVDLNDLRLDITRTMTDILLLDDKADKEARRIMSTYKNFRLQIFWKRICIALSETLTRKKTNLLRAREVQDLLVQFFLGGCFFMPGPPCLSGAFFRSSARLASMFFASCIFLIGCTPAGTCPGSAWNRKFSEKQLKKHAEEPNKKVKKSRRDGQKCCEIFYFPRWSILKAKHRRNSTSCVDW